MSTASVYDSDLKAGFETLSLVSFLNQDLFLSLIHNVCSMLVKITKVILQQMPEQFQFMQLRVIFLIRPSMELRSSD